MIFEGTKNQFFFGLGLTRAGKCYPQADNLVALAILYNVSPMELLVEEDRVSSSSCLWGNLFAA